jgi:hypothetical protein
MTDPNEVEAVYEHTLEELMLAQRERADRELTHGVTPRGFSDTFDPDEDQYDGE